MSDAEWQWRSPPNWPLPPLGWRPPPGWVPPATWPSAPAGWSFWKQPEPLAAEARIAERVVTEAQAAAPPPVLANGAPRTALVWETRFVMVAFLFPAVISAVILFARHVAGVGSITRFPVIVEGHPVTNLVLGILDYLPVAAMVPLALHLLAQTGQRPSSLGIGMPTLRGDILPGLGLAAASFGGEIVAFIPLAPLLTHFKGLENVVAVGHVPTYYVIWGIAISATTAIAEEVLVNGYLITRLGQFGWTPRSALALSLVLRTSYHVYYGVGFLLTIPFGYLVTRSFQKHRRLTRSISAHFLFDVILTTVAILR